MSENFKIFSGNSNDPLAQEICNLIGMKPGEVYLHKFSNENIKVKILENVRGADVFVVQTASSPVNEHLMELLIMIDALKYASADRITAVIPYYFYVRSDKKDEPRISISARLVADLLETAGANRILTVNLHSPQIMGFSRIPVDQLSAVDIICDYFKQKEDLTNFVAVAPDIGRAKITEAYAKYLKIPMAILHKIRKNDSENVEIRNVIGDVKDKNGLLLDDEILTGRSILEGAKALEKYGTSRLLAGCIHGFFSRSALQELEESNIEKIVITNTIPFRGEKNQKKVKVLSIAQLLADGILAIHDGRSVSSLFGIE